MPRHPFQIAELDEEKLKIKKDTIQIVADIEPGDPEDIPFSNFGLYEDRETHELVFTMCAVIEINPENTLKTEGGIYISIG